MNDSHRRDTTASLTGTSLCTYAIEPPYTERYVRWCGRSATQLMDSLLPDCSWRLLLAVILNQQLQVESVKKALYKEIQQAYYNALNSQAKYQGSIGASQSAYEHYRLTEEKYLNGKAGIAEYNDAKNSYLRAESDLLRSRYECLFQTRLLDFYRGEEIVM